MGKPDKTFTKNLNSRKPKGELKKLLVARRRPKYDEG
jgi:hypothetical protein